MPQDAAFQAYGRRWAESYARYEADEYGEAITVADELLCENNLPHYYRIKCHLVVAELIADQDEADINLGRAEEIWTVSRARLDAQSGGDHSTEDALAELRKR